MCFVVSILNRVDELNYAEVKFFKAGSKLQQ